MFKDRDKYVSGEFRWGFNFFNKLEFNTSDFFSSQTWSFYKEVASISL